jgi:transcriptional regulator with XRE-family HTH domain
MNVGRRVARLRIDHGESLREAAHRTGVSHSTIARIEKGEVTVSFNETLRKIAEGYGVPLEYVLTEDPSHRQGTGGHHRHLTPEERSSLLFTSGHERIRRAVTLVTSGRRGDLTREQLAAALGTDLPLLDKAVFGTGTLADDLAERLVEQLALRTGLSPLWFRWGVTDEAESETAPEWVLYVRLVEKSFRADIHPGLIEMAIDLLKINGENQVDRIAMP